MINAHQLGCGVGVARGIVKAHMKIGNAYSEVWGRGRVLNCFCHQNFLPSGLFHMGLMVHIYRSLCMYQLAHLLLQVAWSKVGADFSDSKILPLDPDILFVSS